ncbi:MAG: hypothetical protein EOP11_00435 [Proteobacteria bacterium]|nr:MAG: hypothetical protein EOP11_00435 [Pseudomonadota bacterium]
MQFANISKSCLCTAAAATALASTLCGCGAGPMDKLTEATTKTTSANFQAADFVAKEDLVLRPVPAEGEAPSQITLPEGTAVTVIETKVDNKAGTLVRLGIDANEESGLPADAWFPLDAALLAGLLQVNASEEEKEEAAASTPAGNAVVKISRAARGKMTYCYRYVKRALLSAGRVNAYLPGESAWMAANALPKHGFRRTGKGPSAAGEGDVCVYSGGPRGHGHIEMKRGGGWWFGYGIKATPMQGRNFIACFTK